MNLTNAQVTLTYELRGVQLLPGDYLYREKVQDKILPKPMRSRVLRRPTYAECLQVTSFSEAFVKHAISAKSYPNRSKYPTVFKMWKYMNHKQRLEFHIKMYVDDISGGNYSYDLII